MHRLLQNYDIIAGALCLLSAALFVAMQLID
jgi:hypothetical protein